MKTRKALAAATLAALPLYAAATLPPPLSETSDTARPGSVVEQPNGPRALYWAGVDGETAALIGVFAGTGNSGINWFIGL